MNSTSQVIQRCQGRITCELPADDFSHFASCIPELESYLNVEFVCQIPRENWPRRNIKASASSVSTGDKLLLACWTVMVIVWCSTQSISYQ